MSIEKTLQKYLKEDISQEKREKIRQNLQRIKDMKEHKKYLVNQANKLYDDFADFQQDTIDGLWFDMNSETYNETPEYKKAWKLFDIAEQSLSNICDFLKNLK